MRVSTGGFHMENSFEADRSKLSVTYHIVEMCVGLKGTNVLRLDLKFYAGELVDGFWEQECFSVSACMQIGCFRALACAWHGMDGKGMLGLTPNAISALTGSIM